MFSILVLSCLPSHNGNTNSNDETACVFYQYIKKYQKSEIDSIIQNNDTTIVIAWTEWCRGSHNTLKNLIPVLNGKSDNIGIISIYCGDKSKLVSILAENDYKYPVYLLSDSYRGFDKIKFNRLFHKLFNNYKSVNYVPVEIICNSQKQVLNMDTIIHVNYIVDEKVAYYYILNLRK